jgi:heme-degrading monooxygenase HmoA
MFCLLFDVKPKKGHLKYYLREVDRLNPILETYSGLKWIDRFSLLSDSEALLSLQIWDSEEAISVWREDQHHLRAQEKGKKVHFQDYRIKIGLDLTDKLDVLNLVSEDKRKLSKDKYFILVNSSKEFNNGPFIPYKSINRVNAYVSITSTVGIESAIGLCPTNSSHSGVISSSIYKLVRDYGMHDHCHL